MTVDLQRLQSRVEQVWSEIASAARDAGRDPCELTLIAVTKFQPLELVQALVQLGVTDFGESRHPEARDKAASMAGITAVRWHFIGQLQTNKARQVRRYADVVHSIDRDGLIDALAEPEPGRDPLDCFLQIDLSGDPGRGGADPACAERLAERIAETRGLHLLGVMAVAPLGEEPRAAFARLRAVSERVRSIVPGAASISAGMSGDFVQAIDEGATHLRVGTAITGPRPIAT